MFVHLLIVLTLHRPHHRGCTSESDVYTVSNEVLRSLSFVFPSNLGHVLIVSGILLVGIVFPPSVHSDRTHWSI